MEPKAAPRKSRLGELLVSSGALTQEQLSAALDRQKTHRAPIGETLVTMGFITDETMRLALASQLGVPFIEMDNVTIDPVLAKLVNRGFARRHALLPVAEVGRTLTIAMDDPTKLAIVEDLTRSTGRHITVVTASAQAIQRGLKRLYEGESPAADPKLKDSGTFLPADAAHVPADMDDRTGRRAGDRQGRRADELFQQVLVQAIERRGSDIHLEMLPSRLHVRFRIDGVLREPKFGALQKELDSSMREIVSRIKILGRMDISERRRPQDGSFRFSITRNGASSTVDLRVSIIPSTTGESVVVRILDRLQAPRGLEALRLEPEMTERLERVLSRTAGIFLVTGPTGSGKSTTLYACLMRLNRPEIRILTAEDPVEYIYEELSQTEVDTGIGNTFAACLRAFLRHDPEVIMVGEVRDEETAEIAFRAAQTGHLLLSTLHTNSAVEALPRLLDLGVHPSLIASSLLGVLSQRLARQVCEHCARPDKPSPELVREFFGSTPPEIEFVRGAGCEACHHIGYRGRALIADLWMPDEKDHLLIMRKAPFEEIRTSAERTSISMAQDAYRRLRSKRTTLEELARILPYSAIVEHRQRAEFGRLD